MMEKSDEMNGENNLIGFWIFLNNFSHQILNSDPFINRSGFAGYIHPDFMKLPAV